MKRITKIIDRGSAKGLRIEWQQLNGRQYWEGGHIECEELATPDFYTVKKALIHHVVELLELEPDDGNRITIKEVSLSYKPDERDSEGPDICTVEIKLTRELRDSSEATQLKTPKKEAWYKGYEAAKPYRVKQHLSDEATRAIDRLTDEAWRYVDGERMQTQLEIGEGDGV